MEIGLINAPRSVLKAHLNLEHQDRRLKKIKNKLADPKVPEEKKILLKKEMEEVQKKINNLAIRLYA